MVSSGITLSRVDVMRFNCHAVLWPDPFVGQSSTKGDGINRTSPVGLKWLCKAILLGFALQDQYELYCINGF